MILILIGFIFYLITYIKIQTIYKRDINDLESDFNRDFEIIKEKSGLPEDIVKSEQQKIKAKISQTRSMINVLMAGIIVLGTSFVIYLGNQILASWLEHHSLIHVLLRFSFLD